MRVSVGQMGGMCGYLQAQNMTYVNYYAYFYLPTDFAHSSTTLKALQYMQCSCHVGIKSIFDYSRLTFNQYYTSEG